MDFELSRLEKLLREEFAEAIEDAVRPIEAGCKRNGDELKQLRADQQAFLLRERSLEVAICESLDESAQELSKSAEAQSKTIGELRDQQLAMLQRDADLLRLQESLEARLQAQVTRTGQESLSKASAAYEMCETGLASLQTDLDELRAELCAMSAGASQLPIASKAADRIDTTAPWSELQRALLQHVATSRSEIIALTTGNAEALRAKLEELRTEFQRELQEERRSRTEQMEGLATARLVERAVAQAKLEALQTTAGTSGSESSGSEAPEMTSSPQRQEREPAEPAPVDVQQELLKRLQAAEAAVVEICTAGLDVERCTEPWAALDKAVPEVVS